MFAHRVTVAAAALACLVSQACAQQPRALATSPKTASDDVFLPGPPEFVCGSGEISTSWSPDGRYAVATRLWSPTFVAPTTGPSSARPEFTWAISVWNSSQHKSTVVWSQTTPPTAEGVTPSQTFVDLAGWLPGYNTAYFTVQSGASGPRTLWRIDARRASASVVAPFNAGEDFTVSPTQLAAFVIGQNAQGDYLRAVTRLGQIGPPIRLGEAATPGFSMWGTDGRVLYRVHSATPPPSTEPSSPDAQPAPSTPGRIVYSYDVATGKTGKLDIVPKGLYEPVSPKQTVSLATSEAKIASGSGKETLSPLWMNQGEGRSAITILIVANAKDGELSPRGDAVLYSAAEGVFVVPLVRMPRSVYDTMEHRAKMMRVVNDVKQVALAAFMYSQDHDETFPMTGVDIKTLLNPYSKSPDIFGGADGQFVYTFGGGSIDTVTNPATTVMGYTPFDDRYVVAFMDGHVQMLSKLPKAEARQ